MADVNNGLHLIFIRTPPWLHEVLTRGVEFKTGTERSKKLKPSPKTAKLRGAEELAPP